MQDEKTVEQTDAILQEQQAYYRARAAEYDEWFLREGRYNYGAEMSKAWFEQVCEVQHDLDQKLNGGSTLDIACGTGLWTQHLVPGSERVTAVDSSREMIILNEQRVHSESVKYVETDIFDWKPTEQYDFVFLSFWLSHVPQARFEKFWDLLSQVLRPGGKIYILDSLREPSATAPEHTLPTPGNEKMLRKLNDGREFQIFKYFYTRDSLSKKLRNIGWTPHLKETRNYFLYGSVER